MNTNLIHSGLDEQSTEEIAHSNVLSMLQKELENIYVERLLWMRQLEKDPVHNKIMQTKDAFVDNDDFDPEEAMEAAVDKRKSFIKKLLKDYTFTDDAMMNTNKYFQAFFQIVMMMMINNELV